MSYILAGVGATPPNIRWGVLALFRMNLPQGRSLLSDVNRRNSPRRWSRIYKCIWQCSTQMWAGILNLTCQLSLLPSAGRKMSIPAKVRWRCATGE